MNKAMLLAKEKIVPLSDLQKNPSKALNSRIVRITKNGKEFGIFFSKEEFEDLMEEQMDLNPKFQKDLDMAAKNPGKIRPISELFKKKS